MISGTKLLAKVNVTWIHVANDFMLSLRVNNENCYERADPLNKLYGKGNAWAMWFWIYSIDQLLFFFGKWKFLFWSKKIIYASVFFSFLRRDTVGANWPPNSGDAQLYAHVKKVRISSIFKEIDIIVAFCLVFLKEILVNILPHRSLTKRHSTGKVLRSN